MSQDKAVSTHYTHGNLLHTIEAAINKLGKTTTTVTYQDLAPIDELHVGGLEATKKLFDDINFANNTHIIDIGCGLGGPARYVADKFGTKVTGLDLTEEFVTTGNQLSKWLQLKNHVDLQIGNALKMAQYEVNSFDAGYMIHSGMNIQDKTRLFEEVNRILKPGASFIIYDCMLANDSLINEFPYPVPWADEKENNHIATIEAYRQALKQNGFEITSEYDLTKFAIEFFNTLFQSITSEEELPPLGFHILMKELTKIKITHMRQLIANGSVCPKVMIAKSSSLS